MGTDGTGEEFMVKMLWQLREFEVAFTSPTEIQLIFFQGDRSPLLYTFISIMIFSFAIYFFLVL